MRVLIITLFLWCSLVSAESFIWYVEEGYKHISNVPKECITKKKTINLKCQIRIPFTGNIPAKESESAPGNLSTDQEIEDQDNMHPGNTKNR